MFLEVLLEALSQLDWVSFFPLLTAVRYSLVVSIPLISLNQPLDVIVDSFQNKQKACFRQMQTGHPQKENRTLANAVLGTRLSVVLVAFPTTGSVEAGSFLGCCNLTPGGRQSKCASLTRIVSRQAEGFIGLGRQMVSCRFLDLAWLVYGEALVPLNHVSGWSWQPRAYMNMRTQSFKK